MGLFDIFQNKPRPSNEQNKLTLIVFDWDSFKHHQDFRFIDDFDNPALIFVSRESPDPRWEVLKAKYPSYEYVLPDYERNFSHFFISVIIFEYFSNRVYKKVVIAASHGFYKGTITFLNERKILAELYEVDPSSEQLARRAARQNQRQRDTNIKSVGGHLAKGERRYNRTEGANFSSGSENKTSFDSNEVPSIGKGNSLEYQRSRGQSKNKSDIGNNRLENSDRQNRENRISSNQANSGPRNNYQDSRDLVDSNEIKPRNFRKEYFEPEEHSSNDSHFHEKEPENVRMKHSASESSDSNETNQKLGINDRFRRGKDEVSDSRINLNRDGSSNTHDWNSQKSESESRRFSDKEEFRNRSSQNFRRESQSSRNLATNSRREDASDFQQKDDRQNSEMRTRYHQGSIDPSMENSVNSPFLSLRDLVLLVNFFNQNFVIDGVYLNARLGMMVKQATNKNAADLFGPQNAKPFIRTLLVNGCIEQVDSQNFRVLSHIEVEMFPLDENGNPNLQDKRPVRRSFHNRRYRS